MSHEPFVNISYTEIWSRFYKFALLYLKTSISLVLIPLFLAKLLIIDTHAFNLIMGDDFSFINPYCNKERIDSKKTKTAQFENLSDHQNHLITISGFCTPQYHIKFFNWKFEFSEDINSQNTLFSFRLSDPYLESNSPPPRV